MGHSVKYLESAKKALNSLPADVQRRIINATAALAETPRPSGCKKLRGRDAYRVRIGDYRVIYEIRDDELIVLIIRVAHRKEVYS